ncbi:MAG: acetylxylan esterase [Candidatus Anammoximicrobium sp.]|nr:acetylxylan esterase [Candidatus Anammoximicrobium sp.]
MAFSGARSFAAAPQTSERGVNWLAEVQCPPATLPADAPELKPLLMDDADRRITTLSDWHRRREQLQAWWLEFLGAYHPQRKGVPKLEVVEEDRVQTVLRQRVRYEVEPGCSVEAYVLKPAHKARACPGVVALHSTTRNTIRQPAGVEGEPEKAFGLKLAQRGFVAICPRCFLWSEDLSIPYKEHVNRFHTTHPGSRGMAKMLYDAVVAVDILCSLPEVDPQRLAAVGHSLGAKEVVYLAALDERIRVTVSSEGGIGTRFSNWEASWYLGDEIRRESFTREHDELLGLIAPRAFLLLGGNSADGDRSWPFISATLPVYQLYGGTPRVGLFTHGKGHRVPPEAEQRIYEWIEAYA